MSLHHFYWNGKERSVSLNKSAQKITLRFIDEEIMDQGLEKISFTKGQSVESFIQSYPNPKQLVVREIITAVLEKSDFAKWLLP